MKITGLNTTQMSRIFILVVLGVLACGSAKAADVEVTVGDIFDRRMTDRFFGGGFLDIALKVSGKVLIKAKSMRTAVRSAVDDTGDNLVDVAKFNPKFEESKSFIGVGEATADTKLYLKNPSRQATMVTEILGELEIFLPQKDTASIITVKNFRKKVGSAISAPALKAAGLEIRLLTKQQLEMYKEAQKKQYEAYREEEKRKGIVDLISGAEMFQLIEAFGGPLHMTERSLSFYIKDPQTRLVAIEFEDHKGKAIEPNSPARIGSPLRVGQGKSHKWVAGGQFIVICDFAKKLPETARIKLYVATPKSVIKVPFKLTNLPLP